MQILTLTSLLRSPSEVFSFSSSNYVSILVVLLLSVCPSVFCCSSSNPKPDNCEIPLSNGQGYNATYSFEQLRKSFRYATPDVEAYLGHEAVFTLEIDRTVTPSDFIILAYTDGFEDCSSCVEHENGTKLAKICTFRNLSESDNGKEVQFYVFSPFLSTWLCYEPSAHLHVLGRPPDINITANVDLCNGIEITSSGIPNDTLVYYYLYDDSTKDVLYSVTSTKASATTWIPPEVLSNHSGVYLVEAIPKNPAGSGKPVKSKLHLTNVSFSIREATIETDINRNFIVRIKVTINVTCILTVPNYLAVSSNCSTETSVHYVNMGTVGDNSLTLYHPLLPSRRNCHISVEDSSGINRTYYTYQNTYNTRSVLLKAVNSSYIEVLCRFLSNPSAEGCLVLLSDEYGTIYIQNVIGIEHSDRYERIGPLRTGNNTVSVYDYINKSYSSSDAVFSKIVYVNQSSSIITDSSSAVTTVLPSPTITGCSTSKCREDGTPINTQMIGIVAGTVIFCLFCGLIVLLGILGLVLYFRRHHKGSTNLGTPEKTQQGLTSGDDERGPNYSVTPAEEQAEVGDRDQKCTKPDTKAADGLYDMAPEKPFDGPRSTSQFSISVPCDLSEQVVSQPPDNVELETRQKFSLALGQPMDQQKPTTETSFTFESTEPLLSNDERESKQPTFAVQAPPTQKVTFNIPEVSPLPSPTVEAPVENIFLQANPDTLTDAIKKPSQATLIADEDAPSLFLQASRIHSRSRNASNATLKDEGLVITPNPSMVTLKPTEKQDYHHSTSIDESKTDQHNTVKGEVVPSTNPSTSYVSTTRTDSAPAGEGIPLLGTAKPK